MKVKASKVLRTILRTILNRHDNYGDLHRAAEILAGYRLDPVENEYERLTDWIHGNRLSVDRYSASERERCMWEFLRRHGWSSADLHRLSDEATQGG